MSSSRYERINTEDVEDARDINGNRIEDDTPISPTASPAASHSRQNSYPHPIPNSPPPSFHSVIEADSALQESFDATDDEEGVDLRNLRRTPESTNSFQPDSAPLVPAPSTSRLGAIFSAPASWLGRSSTPSGRRIGNGNDGVFANISAKPQVEEEEQLPSYEQAAADPPPPFWETTIMAPGLGSDEVFIDGLPVGTFFAFMFNAMISTSLQLLGFLLTYLLHSSHAAKNGSRAGLGITLIQYGFAVRSQPDDATGEAPPQETEPKDPNNYQFDGNGDAASEVAANVESISQNEWLSYIFMIVGWFILIRALTDYLRARRTEAVVLASPDRGLGVAVVAENETPERAV